MPGQRPFIRVIDAPSQLRQGGENFSMKIETNMLDPRAEFHVNITFEPLPGCNNQLCHAQSRDDFRAWFDKRSTIGHGKDRMQQLKMNCALLPSKHTCGLWRVNAGLTLAHKEKKEKRRFAAKTTHTITHQFHRQMFKKNQATPRAFTVNESIRVNGQRPWLRIVEGPSTTIRKSGECVQLTLETNILDPELEITHEARPLDGEDYDDLERYPDQGHLNWSNEFILEPAYSTPITCGEKPNLLQQYMMDGYFDPLGGARDCDQYRIIFNLHRPGKYWCDDEDMEVLAIATHIINCRQPKRSPYEKWTPAMIPKFSHDKPRRF